MDEAIKLSMIIESQRKRELDEEEEMVQRAIQMSEQAESDRLQ